MVAMVVTARRVVLVVLVVLIGGLSGAPVLAADNIGADGSALSDAQVQQVRQNCKQAQSLLQRLQSTDVATRINRGRIYENLLNRLVTPFNSRVGLNRYDASSLTLATATIRQKFEDFKTDYSTYENSFSNVLRFNCEADPRGFYTLLATIRSARERVAEDVTSLNGAIDDYTAAFTTLRMDVKG